ncbi:MAG: hypothetical protein M3Y88_01160 [Chloroflexota bacterium]|nr:hypothetical protein [Chloroflexota bacterium]
MSKQASSSTERDAALLVGESASESDAGAGESGADVASSVKAAASQATETGGQLVDKAREQGTRQAQQQKQRAADALVTLAGSLRKMSGDIGDQDQQAIASVTQLTADKTEQLAQFLRQTDVAQMIGRVEDFGRRQPALFLGAAFGVGLLASRFLKAAGQSSGAGSQRGSSASGVGDLSGGEYATSYGAGDGPVSGADAGYETSLTRSTTSGL